MNHTYWNGEIEIYSKDSVLDNESIIHLWQPQKDNIAFVIPKTHKLMKKDDGYGNDIYTVEKKSDEVSQISK